MPKGLRRFHHTGDWHFITCSCYRRQKFLNSVRRRDLFLNILEQVRTKYDFVVAGYVAMPEHFHLLISEPRIGKLSVAMQQKKGSAWGKGVSLGEKGPAPSIFVRERWETEGLGHPSKRLNTQITIPTIRDP